jgi:hypothetical protein
MASAGSGPSTHHDAGRQQGHADHHRHEPGRHAVDQRLDRQLRALRLLHHGDDPREDRVLAEIGRFHHEAALLVDRAADDPVAAGAAHRDGLAGDHRFVDVGLALQHPAVDRDGLAGTHADAVAGPDLVDRQLDQLAVPLHARALRLQTEQALDRRTRAALGARLEQPAEQDQGHDHRGGLDNRCWRCPRA